MTKEELEKEAKEYADWFWGASPSMMKALAEAYIKGAEPREKRIAELEKKNTALRQDWEIMKNTISEYNDFCDKYISLEKENAELKKKVENLQKYLDTRNCYRECAETWLKLTEAKKLLKQFLEAKNGEDTYKAEWESEQFLKEDNISEHIQRATHNYND